MIFHNEIMNISSEKYKVCWSDAEYRIYKIGHRDARHAAAEIAMKADARIEELEEMGRKFQQALEMIAVGDVSNAKQFADDLLVELGIWSVNLDT